MTSIHDLTCELSSTDPLQVSCHLPGMSWIELVAGFGSALGTLVAAVAAVVGVCQAFKQRARADKIEKNNTLQTVAGRYFESLNALAETKVDGRYKAGGFVHRALFDFTNILRDGDAYQKRLAEALSVVTGPVIEDVMNALGALKGGDSVEGISYKIAARSARSLAEEVAEQAQSTFNVVLNVESVETKEGRLAFFERRATSLASQITERLEREKTKK